MKSNSRVLAMQDEWKRKNGSSEKLSFQLVLEILQRGNNTKNKCWNTSQQFTYTGKVVLYS